MKSFLFFPSEKYWEAGSSRKQKLPIGAALTQVTLFRCVSVQVKGAHVSVMRSLLDQNSCDNCSTLAGEIRDRNQTINTHIFICGAAEKATSL